jgi:hypothetical protein
MNSVRSLAASKQRPILLASGSIVLLAALVTLSSVFRSHYLSFVAAQNARYHFAVARTLTLAHQFANDTNVVAVQLLNPMGGTMNVYFGVVRATQEVQPGVDIAARPQPIDIIQPHGRNVVVIHDWKTKYLVSTTTYAFLGAVNGFPDRLRRQTIMALATIQKLYTWLHVATPILISSPTLCRLISERRRLVKRSLRSRQRRYGASDWHTALHLKSIPMILDLIVSRGVVYE